MNKIVQTNNFSEMYSTPIEIANEIGMMGTASNKCLLLEGESDSRFWNHMQSDCSIKYQVLIGTNCGNEGGNKNFIIETVKILNERKISNYAAIIDMDYDFISKKGVKFPNLYYYRYHDLETTLFYSTAYKSFYIMLISDKDKEKIQKLFLDKTLEIALEIGILRIIKEEKEISVSFQDLDYKKIVEKYQERSLHAYIFQTKGISHDERGIILDRYLELKDMNLPLQYVCNGHDILGIMTQFIKKQKNRKQKWEDLVLQFQRDLSLAYPKIINDDELDFSSLTSLLIKSSQIDKIFEEIYVDYDNLGLVKTKEKL